MSRQEKLAEMTELREKLSEMLIKYNELSNDINLGTQLAIIEGSFEIDYGESLPEEPEEGWSSSSWCS